MCGKARRGKLKKENMRKMVGIVPIVNKLKENRLMWFGHLQRRPIDMVVKKREKIIVSGNGKGREIPLTWETGKKSRMEKMIHVADPN